MTEKVADLAAQVGKLLPNQDWIERDGFYRVKIAFGEHDYAILTAVSNQVAARALELVGEILEGDPAALLQEGRETLFMERFFSLTQPDRQEKVWTALDEILSRTLTQWSLEDYAKAYGCEAPKCPTAKVAADERIALFRALPLSITKRLLYALLWHAGN